MSWGCGGMIFLIGGLCAWFLYRTLWGKGVAWPGER